LHKRPSAAHEGAARQPQVGHPFASRAYPYAQSVVHAASAGQATPCVPLGQFVGALHVHVGQPFASSANPVAHEPTHATGAHVVAHVGACHAHLPSVPRAHIAEMTFPPGHCGVANGGGGPQSVCVHAGGGLQAHVGQPVVGSTTLPYGQ